MRPHLIVARVGLAALALGACAPARAAAPPVPELERDARPLPTTGVDAGTNAVAADERTGDEEGTVDFAPGANTGAPGADGATMAADLSGWSAFEDSLRRSILDNGSPSLSVAVIVDGQLVREVALGRRGVDSDRAVEAGDRFRVASISKIVTAVVLLQIVQDGLVGLDEPIGARLAASVGVPEVSAGTAALTVEHLLSHTSGIGAHHSSFFGERGTSCPDAAARALAAYQGTPGGGTSYSNMNYCLAHLLIEELTGQTYVDAAYQRLLGPLGITGMRLAGTYDSGPGEAVHFSRPGRNYMEALGGAGGWIATAADIARIVDSLDPDTPGWRPLGDDMLRRMRQPPLGRASGGYGLGLILYPDGSVGHTGTLESTHAMVLSRPDGVTWAVLVNGEYPRESGNLRSIVDRAIAAGFPEG